MCLGNMSLKRKAFVILLDDLKTTFNLTIFWQDRKMSFNCF